MAEVIIKSKNKVPVSYVERVPFVFWSRVFCVSTLKQIFWWGGVCSGLYKEETLLLSWKVQPGSSGRSTSVCSVVLVMDGKPVHSGGMGWVPGRLLEWAVQGDPRAWWAVSYLLEIPSTPQVAVRMLEQSLVYQDFPRQSVTDFSLILWVPPCSCGCLWSTGYWDCIRSWHPREH